MKENNRLEKLSFEEMEQVSGGALRAHYVLARGCITNGIAEGDSYENILEECMRYRGDASEEEFSKWVNKQFMKRYTLLDVPNDPGSPEYKTYLKLKEQGY